MNLLELSLSAGGRLAAALESPRRPSNAEEDTVALFDEFRTPIHRYLLSCRIPPCDAEEIVQEVFLLLFQHLRLGKSRRNLPGWMFRTAHHFVLKHRDRARRDMAHLDASSSLPAAMSPGPEACVQFAQRQRRLLAVVQALPEVDRCCLSLRAEGLRYREIAEVLGISLGAVANALERSIAKLSRVDEG